MTTATAQSHPNIAFIKYWGNREPVLRIPANGSISMNLDGLETRTTVAFEASLAQDQLTLNDQPASEEARRRVSALLDRVRRMAGVDLCASVESRNNFPTGAGIASSASAFAALSLAASAAAGLQLNERECSRLARTGSGSACRSVPGGFVEWQAGTDDESSYAYSLAPAEHWDLVDCVAVASQTHKPTGSTQGHALADSSPLQAARVADRGAAVENLPGGNPAARFCLAGSGGGAGLQPDARGDDDQPAATAVLAACHPGRYARGTGMAPRRTAGLLHDRRRPECTRALPGRLGPGSDRTVEAN